MKQTPVEWIFQELDNYYHMESKFRSKKKILDKAKEMEEERKETQNKELYDDLVDLLEKLRPIYKEDSDLHLKYEQKRLDLIELLKKK